MLASENRTLQTIASRYVLEGSVQRDQNRLRVNAQLIDAESGALFRRNPPADFIVPRLNSRKL
jgi:TolB-like protein